MYIAYNGLNLFRSFSKFNIFPSLTFTEISRSKIKEITDMDASSRTYVRITTQISHHGMKYTFSKEIKKPSDDDMVINESIVINKSIFEFIQGSIIQYEDSFMRKGLFLRRRIDATRIIGCNDAYHSIGL